MSKMTHEQGAELFRAVLNVYARQMALLKLLHDEARIDATKIDNTLRKCHARVYRIPNVADAIAKNDMTQIRQLVRSLESIRWDHWLDWERSPAKPVGPKMAEIAQKPKAANAR
ncbi:MAG: hypothetical protein DMG59_03425 [Acidobacteria bacterium]|jgi:hypothetical protein|nr:MAG: hypothetical protein DMG59_03425 [Acidobacteriota bacterium]